MATFYFNGAVDNDWATLGNWWTDDTFTTQATSLPTSADDVIASASIDTNSGSEPTVVNFTLSAPGDNYPYLGIAITITGDCTFNDSSYFQQGAVTGDCTFNGSGRVWNTSTITGDCIFNDSSYSDGTITGDCIFNDSSYSDGTITGNCTFNDSSALDWYTAITGNCTFNGSSRLNASWDYGNPSAIPNVTGDCTFNDSSYANNGLIDGNGTFNNSSYNNGGFFLEDCTFNDSSYIYAGTVIGDCTFNDSSYCQQGIITGVARFRPTSAAIQISYILAQAQYGLNITFGSVEVIYDKGVNGSSILGVV